MVNVGDCRVLQVFSTIIFMKMSNCSHSAFGVVSIQKNKNHRRKTAELAAEDGALNARYLSQEAIKNNPVPHV